MSHRHLVCSLLLGLILAGAGQPGIVMAQSDDQRATDDQPAVAEDAADYLDLGTAWKQELQQFLSNSREIDIEISDTPPRPSQHHRATTIGTKSAYAALINRAESAATVDQDNWMAIFERLRRLGQDTDLGGSGNHSGEDWLPLPPVPAPKISISPTPNRRRTTPPRTGG